MMAESGGMRQPNMEVLALAKGVGKDWMGKHVTKPKLDIPHLGLLEHVPFETFLKQHLKECGVCKPMFLQKETLPNEVNPISKWVPRQGTMPSKNTDMDKGNNKNQRGAHAMRVFEMLPCGGAAGTDTSGRSLVCLQMQAQGKKIVGQAQNQMQGRFLTRDWPRLVVASADGLPVQQGRRVGCRQDLSRKAIPVG